MKLLTQTDVKISYNLEKFMSQDGITPTLHDVEHAIINAVTNNQTVGLTDDELNKINVEVKALQVAYGNLGFITSTLEEAKAKRRKEIKDVCEAKLSSYYSALDLMALSNLLMEAMVTGKTNRAAHLVSLQTWALQIYNIYFTSEAIINNTIIVINVYDIPDPDFTGWEALKPNVSFMSAVSIPD